MIQTLSTQRLRMFSVKVGEVTIAEKTFEILRSKNSIVDQYYVVIAWRDLPPHARIAPLAHLRKSQTGLNVIAWQPEEHSVREEDLDLVLSTIIGLESY